MSFEPISIVDLEINPLSKLDSEWALLSAGDKKQFNAMTISWGAFGTMWHKPVFIAFVRPSRYTKEFIDNNDTFTVSFFSPCYRDALSLLGSKSGRNSDKIKESKLTPAFIEGTITFNEASEVYVCKKLFGGQQIDGVKFVETALDGKFYPKKDYHFIYFGAIEKVLMNK